MRIIHISGEAAVGKSTVLNILAEDAKGKVVTGAQLCDIIRLHEKGVISADLPLANFVDEVTPREKKIIETFVKANYPGNDYVMVMVKSSGGI